MPSKRGMHIFPFVVIIYRLLLRVRATQSNYLQIRNIQVQFRSPNTESCTEDPNNGLSTRDPQRWVTYLYIGTLRGTDYLFYLANMCINGDG